MKLVKAYKDGVEYLFDEYKKFRDGKKGGYRRLNGDMNDDSGNSHNGTGTANYTTGKYGQGYNARSSSYYVSVANTEDLYPATGGKFSFGFWICPSFASGQAVTKGIISMTQNIDRYPGWSVHNDSVAKRWQIRVPVSNTTTYDGNLYNLTWSANEWFHFVATFDGTTMRYYKNKTLLGSTPAVLGNCATTYPLTIGYASTWSSSGTSIYDDVFVVKDYCLTDKDIAKFYDGIIL